MKGWLRGRPIRKEERGEALIEFVLLAPILILLLLGLVDFGRLFDAWLVTTNAAREGARYASIYAAKDYLTNEQVTQLSTQKTYQYLVDGFDGRSDVDYTIGDISVTLPPARATQPVTVNVSVRVQVWALLNIFMSNNTTLQGSATMRI